MENWEVFETVGAEPGSLNGTGANGLNVCENGGAMPLPPFRPQRWVAKQKCLKTPSGPAPKRRLGASTNNHFKIIPKP